MAIYEDEWKGSKMVKVQVVFLYSPTDFEAWHVALRRFVKAYGMGDALLYSVPENQVGAMEKRVKTTAAKAEEAIKVKREAQEKSATLGTPVAPDVSIMTIDLTQAAPLVGEPRSEEQHLIMKCMGITAAVDEFFSATIIFENFRTRKKESEKENFYRQEIWQWMESSLTKGPYKYVVRTIQPVFDIHALYAAVINLANKPTWISHALEFKKIFTICMHGNDIFQYHAELIQQVRLVKSQGIALGIETPFPMWMEQSMLLLAAHESPHYRKIAQDFVMDDKCVTIDALVRELQKHQLITTQLNQSGRGGGDRNAHMNVRLVCTWHLQLTQNIAMLSNVGPAHDRIAPFCMKKTQINQVPPPHHPVDALKHV